MAKLKPDWCRTCQRQTMLTFHHLIPRKMHRRTHFKKHFTKEQLQAGIMLCRTCHSGIHKRYSEMQLATLLNNEALLLNDPELERFFTWVSKQKIQT